MRLLFFVGTLVMIHRKYPYSHRIPLAFVVYVLEATRGDGKWRQLKAVHKTISLSAPYAGYDELGSLVLLALCSISVYKRSIP